MSDGAHPRHADLYQGRQPYHDLGASPDLSRSFRATLTLQDASGNAVAGVLPFSTTIYVEPELVTLIPTGNIFFAFEDFDGSDFILFSLAGRIVAEDHGANNNTCRWNCRTDARYGNGSLKVTANGVLKTAGVDFTETMGIAPQLPQRIVCAAGLTVGNLVDMVRHEQPGAYQMICDRINLTTGQLRGDKPTTNLFVA